MADNEQQSIELARWFAKQLVGRTRSQQRIMLNEEADQVKRVYGTDIDRLLEARNEYFKQAQEGNRIPLPEGRPDEENGLERAPHLESGDAALATVGIGAAGLSVLSGKNYNQLIEDAQKKAQKAADTWEKEEANLRSDPSKKSTPGRAESVEEEYRRALAEAYDSFVNSSNRNTNKAFKWTKEHPDDHILAQSLIRNEILKNDITPQRALELKKRYIELEERTMDNLPLAERAAKLYKFRAIAAKEFDSLIDRESPVSKQTMNTESTQSNTQAATNEVPQAPKASAESATQADNSSENDQESQSPPQQNTIETSTQRAKRLQRESIESLRQQGTESSQVMRGGSIENAWPEYSPRALPPRPQPEPSFRQNPQARPAQRPFPKLKWENPLGSGHAPAGRYGVGNSAGTARKALKIASKAKWFLNPYVLGGLGIILLGFVVFLIILNICQLTSGIPLRNIWLPAIDRICGVVDLPKPPANPEGVNIILELPDQVDNDQPILYKIKVVYNKTQAKSPIEDMTLVDSPNFDHEFVSANPQPGLTRGTAPRNSYAWDLTSLSGIDSGETITYNVELTVKPTVKNIVGENWVYIEGASVGDNEQGSTSQPTSNTCSNKYSDNMTAIHNDFSMAENTNYGDPTCSFSNSKLKNMLQTSDPDAADFWMEMARCESRVNPNSYGRHDDEGDADSVEEDIKEGERDPKTGLYTGTWGLFQMGRSYDFPFKQRTVDDNNKRGDVPWQIQVQNAISYKNENGFNYWQAARCLCATSRYSGKPYCNGVSRVSCSYCQ